MTLYEINKQGYQTLPPMDEATLDIAQYNVCEFLRNCQTSWYMLLSNEKKDFTVFDNNVHNVNKLTTEIFDVIRERGTLKGVDIRNEDIDFWIEINEEVFLYKLFSYDWGVIKI